MSAPLEPPALAERSLRALIGDPEWREAVSGDMREEFASVARRRGAAAARTWYWRQALRLTGRFAAGRLLRRRDLMRPWSPSSDFEETGGWRRGWFRDVRHAARAIGRRPSLAAVVALTLGLALAANTTIYGLIDALVLRPYRFAGVDRLVLIASDSPTAQIVDRESVSAFDFREWRESSRTVTGLAAIEWWNANLSEVDTPELLPAFKVTPNFFDTMSVQAGARPPVHKRGRGARQSSSSRPVAHPVDAEVCRRPIHGRPDDSDRRRAVRSHRGGAASDSRFLTARRFGRRLPSTPSCGAIAPPAR